MLLCVPFAVVWLSNTLVYWVVHVSLIKKGIEMNKSYRSIYNEELGAWVAVAENVPAKGKKVKPVASLWPLR